MAALEQPLADAAEELERASEGVAEVQTPWLVDPLSSGVADFADEVEETLPDAELAIDGVEVGPALFGGEASAGTSSPSPSRQRPVVSAASWATSAS